MHLVLQEPAPECVEDGQDDEALENATSHVGGFRVELEVAGVDPAGGEAGLGGGGRLGDLGAHGAGAAEESGEENHVEGICLRLGLLLLLRLDGLLLLEQPSAVPVVEDRTEARDGECH